MRIAAGVLIVCLSACGGAAPEKPAAEPAVEIPALAIYVTNEASGDLTIIDGTKNTALATIPLGKRPRGIAVSPDRKFLYVALSGSPVAGPGVDESKLPPPDRSADGIGVVDLKTRTLVKVYPSGQDPEAFDLAPGGKTIYVSNEETSEASVLDLDRGEIVKRIPVCGEPE